MGKKHKDKDEVPNPNSAANRDIIQRLNFLYQASVYLNSVGAPAPSTSGGPCVASDAKQEKGKRKRSRRSVVSTMDLSRSYIKSMKVVGQKTTVKMYVSHVHSPCSGPVDTVQTL
jgi:ribonuclease P protein subunit RPR2